MKFIYLLSALLVLQLSPASCKKESEPTKAKSSIHGLWIGTYRYEQQTPGYFSFIIKPDGTLLVESKFNGSQQLAQGTWSLNGEVLTCHYTYFWGSQAPTNTIQTSTATFNEDTGDLTSGVWQNTAPNSNTGSFSLSKVNCNNQNPSL